MHANTSLLHQHAEFLTSIRPFRNYKNLASLNKVADYIKKEFSAYGLSIEEQTWEAEGNIYRNIIASYNTTAAKRLIVGAHYDVCGDQPGADDNASAVAGLLETARMLAEEKPSLNYRIDFVAYCLEEPPFFATANMGSFVHAKSQFDAKVDVLGMICYEMIGYFSDTPGSQNFPIPQLAALYPNTGNFIMVVGIEKYKTFNKTFFEHMKTNSEIGVYAIDFPTGQDLAGLSDHRNYWHFGFPALMINDTSFLRNPNYHEVTDTLDTLDFTKMKAVVEGVYRGVVRF